MGSMMMAATGSPAFAAFSIFSSTFIPNIHHQSYSNSSCYHFVIKAAPFISESFVASHTHTHSLSLSRLTSARHLFSSISFSLTNWSSGYCSRGNRATGQSNAGISSLCIGLEWVQDRVPGMGMGPCECHVILT